MVKLGFIVEGATEKIMLEKSDFFSHLKSLHLEVFNEVINAKGKGNLLPQKVSEYLDKLNDNGVTMAFILSDLDEDKCITETKNRISAKENQIAVISVKEIEAWFLADTSAMRSILRDSQYYCDSPESIAKPFDEIKNERLKRINRGVDDKKILANLMIKNHGFSILKAAQHPNCHSARYFLKKISEATGKTL